MREYVASALRVHRPFAPNSTTSTVGKPDPEGGVVRLVRPDRERRVLWRRNTEAKHRLPADDVRDVDANEDPAVLYLLHHEAALRREARDERLERRRESLHVGARIIADVVCERR